MNRSFLILNVAIEILTFQEVLARILHWAKSQPIKTRQVVTVNPEFLMQATSDAPFKRILQEADLRTVDGVGLRLAGEFLIERSHRPQILALGWSLAKALVFPSSLRPFPEVVTGADLTIELLRRAASERLRVFLLGANDPTIDHLVTVLRGRYHRLVVAGESGGTVTDQGVPDDRELIKRIAAFRPHLLLLALGAPKQEQFIHRYRNQLGASVAIGVGGTFDYLVGSVPRAPWLLRTRGFEWLWRLLWQPSRWQRILTATYRFVTAVYRSP